MNALAQLGMVSVNPTNNQTTTVPIDLLEESRTDYFVERNGEKFAGTHLLVDMWDAKNLDDPVQIDKTLRKAAIAAKATIIHSHFHHFTPNGGVSGVVVLAESHISIHTWPERHFAAVDIFMCGNCDPHMAIPVMQHLFQAKRLDINTERRGRIMP